MLRVTQPEIPPAYLVSARTSKRKARFSIDRHLKENGLPLTGSDLQFKYLYYPYWKIDGVLLKVRNRIETREYGLDENGNPQHVSEMEKTDVSLTPYSTTLPAGAHFDGIPEGIGVRAAYLKLAPFSRDNTQDGFDPLPVIKQWKEACDELLRRVNSLAQLDEAAFGVNRTELYRPVASLVYFPCIVAESYAGGDFNRFVIDAVTGRLLDHLDRLEYSDDVVAVEPPQMEFGQLGVDFHRCPNCADDLPPELPSDGVTRTAGRERRFYFCNRGRRRRHRSTVSILVIADGARSTRSPAASIRRSVSLRPSGYPSLSHRQL